MNLQSLFICDSASVREGLLHVLGGGINRLWRPELPAPLNVAFACLIALESEECDRLHEVHLVVANTSHRLGDVMGAIEAKLPPMVEPGERVILPLVLPLHNVGTDAYGRHVISLDLDGQPSGELQFWVLHPDELTLPSPA